MQNSENFQRHALVTNHNKFSYDYRTYIGELLKNTRYVIYSGEPDDS